MDPAFDPYHKWLGISPEEQPPDHYRLLGIKRFEADADVIQTAADQRMFHLRTYQTGHYVDWSQRLLNEVAAAKLCLLQPTKRAAYDAELQARWPTEPPPAPPPQPPRPAIDPTLAELLDDSQAAQTSRRLALRKRTRASSSQWLAKVVVLAGAAVVIAGLIAWRVMQEQEPLGHGHEKQDATPSEKTIKAAPAPADRHK